MSELPPNTIPLDDHVRLWRIATKPNYLRDFHAKSVIKRNAWEWQRKKYVEGIIAAGLISYEREPKVVIEPEEVLDTHELDTRIYDADSKTP